MIFRSCTRSLRRDLIFIKSSSNWKGQTFQRVSNQRTPPRTLSNQRHTSKSHQVRIRKRSAFHIPGKAREGIAAARGMLARSSSNVNCKNNSSDCELAHTVRLKYSLKSFLRRRKRWQIRSQGGEIRHSKPRTGTETPVMHRFPGASPQCAYLRCAVPHFPSRGAPLAEEGRVQSTLGLRT